MKYKKRRDSGTIKKRQAIFEREMQNAINILYYPTIKKRYGNIALIEEVNTDTLNFNLSLTFPPGNEELLKDAKEFQNKMNINTTKLINSINKHELKKEWKNRYEIRIMIAEGKKRYFNKWANNNKEIVQNYLIHKGTTTRCCICLRKMHQDRCIAILFGKSPYTKLRCNHQFHESCFAKLYSNTRYINSRTLKKRIRCPLCRDYDKSNYWNNIHKLVKADYKLK